MSLNGNLITSDFTYLDAVIVDHDPIRVTGSGANELRHFRNTMIRCDDVYTFCVSMSDSEDLHKFWFEKEGYDACYKIRSVTAFYDAIAAQMTDCNFVTAAPALYYDEMASNNNFTGSLFHPALLKRKGGYASQAEYRGVWKPKTDVGPLDNRTIYAPGIGNYCEQHRVLSPK
jgi:hypothetical protein